MLHQTVVDIFGFSDINSVSRIIICSSNQEINAGRIQIKLM
ncbi:hypothetical protein TALC_01376 [Thermoplasmatales archaeon BRNA1]|nr:hypothetical protein TALC_01376 [Thermoplasmatales archaeon BRNA1]